MSVYSMASTYWRLALGFRRFLREPITFEQSREIIRQRLKNREQNLLTIVKRAIYDNKRSPYLQLLRLAGCEYGDFEQLVRSNGIEAALKKLCQEGVYLSIEEFKGKKAVTRGGKEFLFQATDFDKPYLPGHIEVTSSASRNTRTRTIYDFDNIAMGRAVYAIIWLDAFDALDLPIIMLHSIIPGLGPLHVLQLAKAGKTPTRWFSPISSRDIKPSLIDRIATNYIIYMGRLWGAKLPAPEYIRMDEYWKLASLIADFINRHGGCCVQTGISQAVRICHAAREKGLNITGVKFISAGEPLTDVKRQEIESAGAQIYIRYAILKQGT